MNTIIENFERINCSRIIAVVDRPEMGMTLEADGMEYIVYATAPERGAHGVYAVCASDVWEDDHGNRVRADGLTTGQIDDYYVVEDSRGRDGDADSLKWQPASARNRW